MIASVLKLNPVDDTAAANMLGAAPIRISVPNGLRQRRFSFAAACRFINTSTWPTEGTGRYALPFEVRFIRNAVIVDTWRFYLRENSDAGIVQNTNYVMLDGAIPAASLAGWDNTLASGSMEGWLGLASECAPGAFIIPFRSEYDAAATFLREFKHLSLSPHETVIDCDTIELRCTHINYIPAATAGNYGTFLQALVCWSNPTAVTTVAKAYVAA